MQLQVSKYDDINDPHDELHQQLQQIHAEDRGDADFHAPGTSAAARKIVVQSLYYALQNDLHRHQAFIVCFCFVLMRELL